MKSVIIDKDLHYKFKMYCKGKNLKIGGLIEDILKTYIRFPKEFNQLMDKYRKEVDNE